MSRNGTPAALRVLVSGTKSDDFVTTLMQEPGVSVVWLNPDGGPATPAPDVALHVVSGSGDVAEAVAKVRAASDVPLILAAYGEPNGIVDDGLRVGAADVVVLPQSIETLLFALRKAALANGKPRGNGKVVTVFSPKGGSGKTVVATNLAVATQRSGVQTLLVDLDLQFGDAALTLSIAPKGTIADLAVAAGDIDVETLKTFVSTDPGTSLALLAAPKRPEDAQIVGQSEIAAVLDVARSAYEVVVIDTGPLFDGAMLAALDRSDQLLLVCNPEVTSLKNVRLGLETIDRLGFPRERVSIVANRMGAAGGVTRADIEEALETEISFELPDDPAVPAAVNRATPVVLTEPSNRFSRAVSTLAKALFAPEHAPPPAERRRSLLRGRR
jgi:pilus assembly protein CpaE